MPRYVNENPHTVVVRGVKLRCRQVSANVDGELADAFEFTQKVRKLRDGELTVERGGREYATEEYDEEAGVTAGAVYAKSPALSPEHEEAQGGPVPYHPDDAGKASDGANAPGANGPQDNPGGTQGTITTDQVPGGTTKTPNLPQDGSGNVDPKNETVGSPHGGSAESVDPDAYNKDELTKMAKSEGVDVQKGQTKAQLAEAINAKREDSANGK